MTSSACRASGYRYAAWLRRNRLTFDPARKRFVGLRPKYVACLRLDGGSECLKSRRLNVALRWSRALGSEGGLRGTMARPDSTPRRGKTKQPHRQASPKELETKFAEILARNLLASDPEPALEALRAAAGEQTVLLARFCGEAAGFFMSPRTANLCSAIITEIDGAADWAEVGRQRRQRATSQTGPDRSAEATG